MRNKYAYLGNNIGLTVLFQDSYCYLDTEDVSLTPHLIRYGTWENNVTKIFMEKLPTNSIVFDIGANIGYYSLLAASKNNRVYAFDPIPKYMKLLNMSSKINGFPSAIHCEALALGNENKTMKFHINKMFKGSSSITREWNKDEEEIIEIQMITLNKYCADNHINKIDFMKIDAEAYEFNILKDCTIPIEKMLIEFNSIIFKNQKKFEENFGILKSRYNNIQYISNEGNLYKINNIEDFDKFPYSFHMLYCSNE